MRRSRSSGRAAVRPAAPVAIGGLAVMLAACGARPESPAAPGCPVDRVMVVASREDVARLSACPALRGVAIRTGAALDVSALPLATIAGDLVIGPTVAVHDITLPGLRVVEGAIRVVANGMMQRLALPALERAGRIEIEGNVSLTMISLPRLATVAGALRIRDNASLELVDVSALRTVGAELVLAGVPQLTLVETEQLERAGAVQIDAPSVPSDVADRLRASAASP